MSSGQTGNIRLAFNPTLDRIEKELDSLRTRSLYRTLESMDGSNFCSNDYLALSKHPDLAGAVRDAITSGERVASTGSRLLSGHVDAWEEVEEEFADYVGAEASLFFNSGYAANIGILTSILSDGDIVFSDSANHASLIDGMRLSRARKVIFPHLDLDALEDLTNVATARYPDPTRGAGEGAFVAASDPSELSQAFSRIRDELSRVGL